MRYFAEKNGEDADYWESVGILHDIDFEKHPDAHCIACADIFACAMARPSKSVTDMELNDVILGCLEAMRARHEECGC